MTIPTETLITILIACLGSAGLWTLINNIYLTNKKEDETIGLIKQALLATLHDRLLYLCTKYLEDYAEIGIEANQLHSLHNLFESYKSLGGNGLISDLVSRVNKLKVR